MLNEFLSKILSLRNSHRFSDSKKQPEEEPEIKPKPKPYTPTSVQDFIGVIKRTPLSVISKKGRARIAAVMSFDERIIADLMIPKTKMVFVNSKDLLGPLMLDRLYKSGFTNFPVVDNHDHVKGIIHTEALNALEIKKTDRAEKYMDKTVSYLHTTDSLEFAVEEIERTNSYYFLVLDPSDELAGFFTAKILLDYLLG
ncbi:MAG: CBS domain-containing protein [Candidatus Saccharibacteria bacterium]|nr:CBS domain-containing protein [Candidatus Saccharibacteria bacterium]